MNTMNTLGTILHQDQDIQWGNREEGGSIFIFSFGNFILNLLSAVNAVNMLRAGVSFREEIRAICEKLEFGNGHYKTNNEDMISGFSINCSSPELLCYDCV